MCKLYCEYILWIKNNIEIDNKYHVLNETNNEKQNEWMEKEFIKVFFFDYFIFLFIKFL